MDTNQEDADLINAVVNQQLGVDNLQQQPPQQTPQQPAAKADAPTPQEAASSNVAPKTEGAKSKADPFEFFEAGNGKVYTPDQLRGIASRYADLNYKHQTEVAPISKSVTFLNQLRQQAAAEGLELNDDQMAQMLETALAAFASNPTMNANSQAKPGQQQPGRQDINVNKPEPITDVETALAQWEQQNAVTLPPMYKEAVAKTGALEQQIQALTEMVQNLSKSGAQIASTAEGKLTEAKETSAKNAQQQIVNNLSRIQNEFQFPDEAEQDFMAFVQGRGYDVWELMDYNLAHTLASDFKNNQQAPDLERFRQMAQRRQAFTGNLSPSSSSTPAASPQQQTNPDQEMIDSMTSTIMKKKFME